LRPDRFRAQPRGHAPGLAAHRGFPAGAAGTV